MPSVQLDEAEFRRRFLSQFADGAFEPLRGELDQVAAAAWEAYAQYRKWPRTRQAGPGFADPECELGVEWLAAHEAVKRARAEHDDPAGPDAILVINGSSRSEHTCPGEMSKSWRLAELAAKTCRREGAAVELLNLSRLAAEYGQRIHPCKACFSTAAALCHWPCSCYPNYALGQTQDMMNDIYPLWVRAHGILVVTPVNWYHASSPMKLMIDRLVCADGGNPDPTTTGIKDARKAKALELRGWAYPRHLAGRLFAIVVHGDAAGAGTVRRALADWLRDMRLEPAGVAAEIDRYVGYWEPYATSHEALDRDEAVQEEVRNAARTLVEAVKARRAGRLVAADSGVEPPRQK